MAQNNQQQGQVQDLNEILRLRREKFENFKAEGKDPFVITKYDVTNHSQDIKDDLCIFFSTIFPAKAADIPKKNIASENAHPTAKVLIPILLEIASLNVDQQYTLPIEQ